jgi:hypothetical protein
MFHLASVKTLFHLYLLERCSNSELTEQNIIYNPASLSYQLQNDGWIITKY